MKTEIIAVLAKTSFILKFCLNMHLIFSEVDTDIGFSTIKNN